MKTLKKITWLALFALLAAGCSSHAVYVASEEGYRDNDKLLGLLKAEPVDANQLYGLKPVKLVKPQPKAPAPAAPTAPPAGVVTVYPAEGEPYTLFSQADWDELKAVYPDIKAEADKSRNGRQTYKIAIFPVLPFGFDQPGLTDKNLKEQVAKAMAVIKGKNFKPFMVMGYADPIGSMAHNQSLSSQRADAVVAELKKYELGGIRVVAKGETNQFAPGAATKAQHGPNRTVWLVCFE